MRFHSAFRTIACALTLAAFALCARAEAAEKRIALVVGNAAYTAAPLATPANDAGLVAQTLQAAGFDVIGARDLGEDALRKALRDFVDKAAASGPDTVAFLYLSGYGLQLEGENYFAPIDLRVSTAADIGLRAARLSDYAKSLAALPLKARFIVLDGARQAPFTVPDKPLAGGLALTEAEPGSLIAFNAAPGTVGPEEKGPYGAYAQALVEMIREGGLKPGPLFDRVRLRVDEATKGAEVPWDSDRSGDSVVFLERAADAPPAGEPDKVASLRDRPLRDLGARDAYAVCLERDDLNHYQDFVATYPNDALARRVRALIAARREALVWRRTWLVGTPDAYWSYLSRYPRGPHAWDARRRLASLAAAYEPPPRYTALVYDVPPPPPEEIVYVERPYLYLDDPVYALPPPPPPPVFFLPPQPAYLVALAPPPPVYGVYVLPSPPLVAVPAYVSAPAYVAPPPNNVVFQNIHNTTVIEQINRQAVAAPAAAGIGGAVAGAALGAAVSRVAVPAGLPQPAVAAPGAAMPGRAPLAAAPLPASAAPVQSLRAMPGQPGQAGQALPPGRAAPLPQGAQAPFAAPRALAARPNAAAPVPGQPGGTPPVGARQPFAGRAIPNGQPGGRQAPAMAGPAAAPRPAPPNAAVMQQRQNAMAQRAAAQQAFAARQQANAAVQQRQAAQAMQAQRAQQMADQRQQQMMMQRQQMMQQAPRPQPHAQAFPGRPMMGGGMGQPHASPPAPRMAPPPQQHGGGGGRPHCHPGQPCR